MTRFEKMDINEMAYYMQVAVNYIRQQPEPPQGIDISEMLNYLTQEIEEG